MEAGNHTLHYVDIESFSIKASSIQVLKGYRSSAQTRFAYDCF
jgi:hypothetical protein